MAKLSSCWDYERFFLTQIFLLWGIKLKVLCFPKEGFGADIADMFLEYKAKTLYNFYSKFMGLVVRMLDTYKSYSLTPESWIPSLNIPTY